MQEFGDSYSGGEPVRASTPDLGLSSDQGYLRELLKDELEEGEQDLLKNLVSRDFVLANWSFEQLNELKFDLEIIRDQYFAMHPDDDCVVTGDFRAYCYGDRSETREPLTESEKMKAITYFKGAFGRITRALDMKQQEMNAKTIRENRMSRDDNTGGGGLVGRLRGNR